jgi:hypothetical protein
LLTGLNHSGIPVKEGCHAPPTLRTSPPPSTDRLKRSRPARADLLWSMLPPSNRLCVVHVLGQILIQKLLDADEREVGREDT